MVHKGESHPGEIAHEASEVLPPPPGNPRFPLFDSMRGIAAIAILLVHVGILSGGFAPWYKQLFAHLDIGVPIFFVISGFLLYRPFLAARQLDAPPVDNRDYARNRFFRIFPAYWVVLTLAAIVPGMYGAFTDNWWVYYSLLDNYPVYAREGACLTDRFTCGIPPAWTLSLEVGFYILLPFLAIGLSGLTRLFGRHRWVAVNLGALAAISLVSVYIQSHVPDTNLEQWLFYSPLGRAWWFALGMGLATISVWSQKTGRTPTGLNWLIKRPWFAWVLAVGLYVAMTYLILEPGPSLNFLTTSRIEYLTQYLVFGLIGALALLPAVFDRTRVSLPRVVLRNPALVWLGLISYGIFLWHYPAMIWLYRQDVISIWPQMAYPVLAITTLGLTVVLAGITYYLVERPLMLWSRRRGRRTPKSPPPQHPTAPAPLVELPEVVNR